MLAPGQRLERLRLQSHVGALDGLRGLAIVLVLAVHSLAGVRVGGLGRLFSVGWVGVDLFFVLSGFLITSLLAKGRGQSEGLFPFYGRRMLRTWPLYFLLLLGMWQFGGLLPAPMTVAPGQYAWWPSLLHLQNLFSAVGRPPWVLPQALGVTWSLAIEEQFYLAWPLLMRRTTNLTVVRGCALLLLLSPLLRLLCLLGGAPPYSINFMTFTRLDGLSIGALIASAALLPEADRERVLRWVRRGVVALPIGLAVNYAFLRGDLAILSQVPVAGGWNVLALATTYSAFALGFGGLFVLVLEGSWSALEVVFTWAWLRYLGRISFSLYLLHYPLFELGRTYLAPELSRALKLAAWQGTGLALVVELLASVTVAALSFAWFERPILRWGSRRLEEARAASAIPGAGQP